MRWCLSSIGMVAVAIVFLTTMAIQIDAAYIENPLQQNADRQLILTQLRSEIKRLQFLADALSDLNSPDSLPEQSFGGEAIWKSGEALKRSGKTGTPRRYDSYGVAGRFGRSVDRQLNHGNK